MREINQTGFLYEDVVGGVGRFPPLDDRYRKDQLNLPRTSQKGSPVFKCVVAAWFTLSVLTHWYLFESSDYPLEKRDSGKARFRLGST